MNPKGKLLYVLSVPYDFTPTTGNNAGIRYTGTNYNHYVLRDDGRLVVVTIKDSDKALVIDKRIIDALPNVEIGYSTFMQKTEKFGREIMEEVLKPETVTLV